MCDLPCFPVENFASGSISLPSLPEQKAIAVVLSSLDDKIDLLHRQNLTLEAMAETLFRQWFVVEAREDWEEYAISDFADHIKINVVPSKNADTIFHHYSLPAYDSGQKPTIEIGSKILSNKYKVIENSILVSKLNPRFPRIWAISLLHKQTAICSTEFQVLKPKSESLFGYLYFLLHSNDVKEELTMASSGTSGSHQRVKPEDIFNVKTLLPSVSQAEKFSNQVLPNIKKIEANRIQILTLETLRDTLLPKLMSGDVRVNHV
jgi:type I restriction enzyme S subunit